MAARRPKYLWCGHNWPYLAFLAEGSFSFRGTCPPYFFLLKQMAYSLYFPLIFPHPIIHPRKLNPFHTVSSFCLRIPPSSPAHLSLILRGRDAISAVKVALICPVEPHPASLLGNSLLPLHSPPLRDVRSGPGVPPQQGQRGMNLRGSHFSILTFIFSTLQNTPEDGSELVFQTMDSNKEWGCSSSPHPQPSENRGV